MQLFISTAASSSSSVSLLRRYRIPPSVVLLVIVLVRELLVVVAVVVAVVVVHLVPCCWWRTLESWTLASRRWAGRVTATLFVLSSSSSGPTSLGSGLHVYIFIYGGEVCGRYADGPRLIHASVTASTSVVGSHSKLPSSVIILINGRLFSLGSGVCTSIFTLQFWHHTNYHFLLVMYPPHAATPPSLTHHLGPSSHKTCLACGEGYF